MSEWIPNVLVSPPGPKSQAALKRLQNTIGRGNYMGLYGLFIAEGHDSCVEDLDGNRYLDCLTGAAANNLGYGFPEIAEAYYQTAMNIPHTSFSYSPTLHTLELAERLITMTPGQFDKKALLGLCGSKSNEDALEISWKATGRRKLLCFEGTYLGATWLTKVASGFIRGNELAYDESTFTMVPFPRCSTDSEPLLQLLEQQLKTETIAAVAIEPILCDGGNLVPPDGFYREMASLLRRYGTLLIVDESQTGMGRTGRWWGSEWEGLEPDLIVIGKSLAAGYASISALVGRKELIDILEQGKQIGTFIGHPPSATAAMATINCIEREGLIENAYNRGQELLNGLGELVRDFPETCLDARGRGTLLGLEINRSKTPLGAKLFAMRCLEKGLYLGYYGVFQEVVRIAPPLTLNRLHIEFVLQTMRETAGEMENGQIPEETFAKVEKFAIGLPMPQPATESYCLNTGGTHALSHR